MPTIVATIQQIIRQEVERLRIAELGVVEAVFPHSGESDDDNYGCDVRIQPSDLLLKRVPIATGHIGTAAIPNVGDLVLLVFHHGDVNQPIVAGRLYNADDRPPLNKPDEVIVRLPLAAADDRTVKAAIRNHSDATPPRELRVEMAPKIDLRITDGTVQATAGKSELRLDQPDGSGGTVTVLAGQTKITMDQDGDIVVEAAGAMTIKATRDLTLEGQTVTITGQTSAALEAGTQVSVKGSLGATLDGGLSSTVKGTTVSINGQTSFSP
jgi:uncharacterized protein involved in type VI secretion and phage assembly